MKALVTGATGFIGSHMAELLVEKGWEVVCPVRDMSNLRHLSGIQARAIPLADVGSEVGKNQGFDYVIHLAGATRARDYRGYREANVESTRRLLELFSNPVTNSNLKRFVLIGSQAACGPSPDDGTPVTESDPLCPVSLYGRSKREAEEVALSFTDRVPVTIIRPPTVFGPTRYGRAGSIQVYTLPVGSLSCRPGQDDKHNLRGRSRGGNSHRGTGVEIARTGLLSGKPEARDLERIRSTGCSDCRLSLDHAARATACNETCGSSRRFARQGAQDSSSLQVGEAGRDETDSLGMLSGKSLPRPAMAPGTPCLLPLKRRWDGTGSTDGSSVVSHIL